MCPNWVMGQLKEYVSCLSGSTHLQPHNCQCLHRWAMHSRVYSLSMASSTSPQPPTHLCTTVCPSSTIAQHSPWSEAFLLSLAYQTATGAKLNVAHLMSISCSTIKFPQVCTCHLPTRPGKCTKLGVQSRPPTYLRLASKHYHLAPVR
jgi:hypothetical protein